MNTLQDKSQTKRILDHFLQGKSLTPLEALRLYECLRLSARVLDFKKMGYEFETIIESNGKKKFASYRLKPKDTLF